jgi:hypothetical protein
MPSKDIPIITTSARMAASAQLSNLINDSALSTLVGQATLGAKP